MTTTPTYLLAAQNHDIARGQQEQGFLDSMFDLVSKGIPATLAAAGTEISNIPATIGNLLTGDDGRFELNKTADVLSAYDSDLAKYYDDHKLGIDTAGFLVGSFAPGALGVKLTRIAPSVLKSAFGVGKAGAMTADSVGLLGGMRQTYLAEAVKQAMVGTPYKFAETNLLRAMAAGVGINAIEGAAATAMVNATMFNSPILDDRSTSDLMWDVLWGAGIGGVVGSVFAGAQASGVVKKATEKAGEEVHPWTIAGLGGEPSVSMSVSDKLLYKKQQLEAIPHIAPDFQYAQFAGKTAEKTRSTLTTEIRALTGELTGGDQELAGVLNTAIHNTSFEKNVSNLWNAQTAVRISKITPQEKALDKAVNQIKSKKLDPFNLPKEIDEVLSANRITYVNLITGATSTEIPKLLNLADTAASAPRLVRGGVVAGKTYYAVGAKAQFDPYKLNHLHAEAHYLHAEKSPAFAADKIPEIGLNDIPKMQKAIAENRSVLIGNTIFSPAELVDFSRTRQAAIAADLVKAGKHSNAEIAKIVNASEDALFGGFDSPDLWNARNVARKQFTANGFEGDPNLLPSHVKLIVSTKGVETIDGHMVDGMIAIAEKQALYQANATVIATEGLGEILPSATGINKLPVGVSTGAKFATSADGAYKSQASFWGYVGQRVNALVQQKIAAFNEVFTPTLQKLANDPTAAIEWSVLNEKLRSLPQVYSLSDDGASLLHNSVRKALDDGIDPATLNLDAHIPAEIPIKSPLVRELVAKHIDANDARRGMLAKVNNNNGYMDRYISGTFYPIPRNPKDTPHFAFVIDQSVNGRGHSQMLYAKDGPTLEQLISEVRSDPDLLKMNLKVITKGEAEAYYKAVGQYEFERTLSENYIQTALARKGKSASYFPLTDPSRIVNDFADWHKQRASMYVRTLVEHQYADQFATLRAMAAPAMEASKSRFGYISATSFAENTAANPATNLLKLALNVNKIDDYPVWSAANKFLDEGFSKLSATIGRIFSKATSPEHLDEISKALKAAGWDRDEVMTSSLYEAMNGKIERGKLASIIAKSNAVIASFALRSDPFNALNNALGHSVLLGPETKNLIRLLEGVAPDKLRALAKIKVPGTEDFILSPAKLIARRIGMFHSDVAGREFFKQHGFSSRLVDQYLDVLNNLGLAISKGDESFIQKAIIGAKNLGDKAEVWTGNKLAEEFNRYVAAGVAKDISDLAIEAGVMSPEMLLPTINTFVNRTQGNYLAAQRPILFQGPIGQAIGLFQTYQFNILQNVFRHVQEGHYKNVALMASLQTGIYGLNGLPGFSALNTYVIGAAGGNAEHMNLYDSIMSGAGKEAGEWLTYGIGSNVFSLFHPDLKTNLYSRGDMNPRQVTIVPLDPFKTPIWQTSERLWTNVKESLKQIQAGGDVWGVMLNALEHNGISRPLAGLAAVTSGAFSATGQVITTNNQGNMLMAHDWLSLTSLMRISGAHPMDEAVMNEKMFRIHSYRTADAYKKEQLGEAIKISIKNGTLPEQEQIDQFAQKYVEFGGKREEFNRFWLHQTKNIQISQAEQLRRRLSSPYSKQIQMMMGE